MPDTTTNVHIDRPVRDTVACLLLHRIHCEPRELRLSPKSHEVIKEAKILGMIAQPLEGMQVGIPSILEDRMIPIDRVPVSGLVEEAGECLKYGRNSQETGLN